MSGGPDGGARGAWSVERDVPLAPMTTLRVGGPAARFARLRGEADVVEALREAKASGWPLFVLGGGSNVVVSDAGFPGLVVRLESRGVEVRADGGDAIVDVSAGEGWDAFVERAVDEGWRGVACLSGIPGLVGATPIQNVGAYGEEVRETIERVRAYDRDLGRFVDLDAASCGFGYRTSVFRRSARWIVTGVRFRFVKGREATVRYPELARALGVTPGAVAPAGVVRQAVIALRRAKGMVLDPGDPDAVSAGSFFVNPVVELGRVADIAARAGEEPPTFDAGPGRRKVAAAWLVERAGFGKGWGEGNAGVSRKHALALVNRGGATARELLGLAATIQRGVERAFGVTLELEPVVVGASGQEERL